MTLRLVFGMLVGAAWGLIFWYFGQCDEGVCLFTSTWKTTVTIGATLGAIWAVWRD
ncbi:MAG: DUF6132 family protein [Endomicrobiia bacterium]|nr:DUF6132 family protein [Endomicrobiia bacterium]